MTWQFTDETQTVVTRAIAGGGSESRLASTLPDEELASITPYSAPSVVPSVVSMRQARLALLQTNKLAIVEYAVSQADVATQITWEYASTVEIHSPLVQSLSMALGFTEADINNLFILAASL
jgi:hypothetical protein